MIVVKVYYADDQCGAGKTTWALRHMAENVGRYVYVIDRREVAKDRRATLYQYADAVGTDPFVMDVFSDVNQRDNIARRIDDAGRDCVHRHQVLIITHAGMKKVADWGWFADWDGIFIDEIPSILKHEAHFTTPFEAAGLRAFYKLKPTTLPGESTISFEGGFNAHDLERSSSSWVEFHQRVVAGDAHCDLTSWDDLNERQEWSSWTIWDAAKLRVFGEVRILGDSFTDTDTFHLMQRQGCFEFERFSVRPWDEPPRRWAQRPVTIRYVSDEKRASSTKLKDEANGAELVKVGNWLAGVGTKQHIWTCNTHARIAGRLTGADIPGEKLTPKQAGSNKWRGYHVASAIYAAKPSPQERRFFSHLGIDADVITASRETYDLKQFFMRTSLRDPQSTAPVELRTLDKWQAEAFAAYLEESYGMTAELVFDDIGLAFAGKPAGRPRGKAMTPDERREADKQRKANSRDKLREAGLSARGKPLANVAR